MPRCPIGMLLFYVTNKFDLIYRTRTKQEPNFLKYSELEQNRTLIIKEPEPNTNPECSVLSHL